MGPKARVQTSETEAAAWHARLGAPGVTPETVQAFFDWRSRPENADAYRRVEIVWGQTAALAGDAGIDTAVDEAMARGREATRPKRLPRTTVGLAGVGLACVVALGVWTWTQTRNVYATGVGEQRLVQLADGSTVRLDTGSRFRVRFTGARREIELEQGQALFSVAHDAGRPFVVRAGEAEVTAIGTVFEVRRLAAGADVTLVSGVVAVAPAGEGRAARRLAAGQASMVSESQIRVRQVDLASATSWTDGRIVFRDTPLRAAVDEVNRYLTDKVELAPGSLGGEPVNGVFKTGDRAAFVSAASAQFGLTAQTDSDGGVRLAPAPK